MPDYVGKYLDKATRPVPTLQLRVIGPAAVAQAVLADRADLIRTILGPNYHYHMQFRTARKAGHVRAYLTVTRKENHDDVNRHG